MPPASWGRHSRAQKSHRNKVRLRWAATPTSEEMAELRIVAAPPTGAGGRDRRHLGAGRTGGGRPGRQGQCHYGASGKCPFPGGRRGISAGRRKLMVRALSGGTGRPSSGATAVGRRSVRDAPICLSRADQCVAASLPGRRLAGLENRSSRPHLRAASRRCAVGIAAAAAAIALGNFHILVGGGVAARPAQGPGAAPPHWRRPVAVIAMWDLTDLERAVLTRRFGR